MEALRIHIKEKHINADFNSAFYKVVDDLKIDISHFKCNICSQDIENVDTFMNHLSGDHGKPVNFDVPFGVLPYRQNETGAWLCLHCDKIYPEFSQINSHLRTHAKISTCDKCGATFLSEHGLKQHERNFQCYKATYKPRFGKALKHKYNTEIILQCSTACPFRTWGQNFNCVFCRVQSNDPNGLRAHMASRHANFDIQLVFSRKLRKEFLKVDITDLQCKLCFMHIDTLDDLLTHLKNDHKQPVNIDVQPGVLPFKLNDGSCWKCAICKIQFSDFISLKKHTAEHYQNYVCDTCGEGFITEVALRAHTKIPHDNKYTCSRCVATFSTLEERSVHIKTQHTNLPYMCTYCKDKPRFATWELRKRHLYEIHNYKSGAEMYECTTCHMMFKTRSQKYHHNVKVHRTKKEIDFGFSCGHCARGRSRETENITDINILQQSHLDTDNDIKVGEKRKYQKSARSQARFMTKKNASSILECWSGIPFRWKKNRFKCAYCEENFNECSDLREHVRLCATQYNVGSIFSKFKEMTLINMDVSEAACRICSEPFRELDGMREHVIRHGYELDVSHPDGVIPFCLTKESWSCVLCRETFNNFLKLYEHMNTHYQYHICSICGKGYMTGPRLRKHLELHITGTFPCDKCKKVFTKRTGRDNHKAYAHAKGPRYECPQCNMRFEGYYDRMNHLKQAHREKEVKYGCSHCDLSFKTSGKRAIHVKTVHFPRQSNFSCPYCKTLFKTAFGMKRHMVKHNGETCTVCGESFTKSKALKEHLAGHADGLRCKWCGNNFKEAALLSTHTRSAKADLAGTVGVKPVRKLKENVCARQMRRRRRANNELPEESEKRIAKTMMRRNALTILESSTAWAFRDTYKYTI
ncbi:zinc finger protein 43-like [Danaus plexippus]|uniref:zinc finger protein 43-like n=1 Tax=Danaus plexippus TaxID=13037 RepID=UPI002AB2A19E|nr:zinc finger protein 43-like [Danaus plexippus]